jgi:hypothetical protein
VSYDIQVWSVAKPNLAEITSSLDGWNMSNGSITFQKSSWQIVVGPIAYVEEEDIPEEVFRALPGIQYLTEINLEPIHAPETARKRQQRMANRIAKATTGVVFDPQQDSISSPRGTKRVSRSPAPERISVFNLTWWFNKSPLIEEGGLAKLLSILDKYLPEAIPRRYGPYEPPQHLFETQGREHFIEFLSQENFSVVWYPNYPVLHVWPGIYGESGPGRQGYRSRYLTIVIDSSIWTQPGWNLALKRAWFQLSDFIHPFFGEVRILDNYILQRGRMYSDGETDSHPVMNGWWNGIPKRLGAAVVIDKHYATLWSRFVNKAQRINALFYVSENDWISGKRVDQLVGRVPRAIRQGKYHVATPKGPRHTYPKKWPFEDPYK